MENNTIEKAEKKAASTAASVSKDIEALKKENQELKDQLKTIIELMKGQQAPSVNIVTPSTDVELVYCSDSMGYLKTAHVELRFNKWGEKFTLSRSEFDEVVGNYRSWFDNGILAVSGDTEEGIKVAAAKGIKTSNELKMSAADLERIGRMSPAEVEALWNSLAFQEHKYSIVTYVKRKFLEGAEGYTRRDLIDLLNRLTNGGFKREQDELDGRYTYEAKQFSKKEII